MAGTRSKYDTLIELVRRKAQARIACVIIFEGNKGNGMGMRLRGDAALDPKTAIAVAGALEEIAKHIRSRGLFDVPHDVQLDKGS